MQVLRLGRFSGLASGGVTLGILQAFGQIDFNNVLFNVLTTVLSTIVALLLGGDASGRGGLASLFA